MPTAYVRDPYSNIAMKPNQMSIDQAHQLQKSVNTSTPAGKISELRKSSPSGHQGIDDPRGGNSSTVGSRGRELAPNGSLGRVGAELSANRAPNAGLMGLGTGGQEYGSIQKVMPKSRDMNPMGGEDGMGPPQYSSKPAQGSF